jgi:hypothetical protein
MSTRELINQLQAVLDELGVKDVDFSLRTGWEFAEEGECVLNFDDGEMDHTFIFQIPEQKAQEAVRKDKQQ